MTIIYRIRYVLLSENKEALTISSEELEQSLRGTSVSLLLDLYFRVREIKDHALQWRQNKISEDPQGSLENGVTKRCKRSMTSDN